MRKANLLITILIMVSTVIMFFIAHTLKPDPSDLNLFFKTGNAVDMYEKILLVVNFLVGWILFVGSIFIISSLHKKSLKCQL